MATKKKAQEAWSNRAPWDAIYQEAYDYAIPQRQPGGRSRSKRTGDFLFDMTAPASAMHFAGNLQRDLFPAGQPTFTMETGPIAAAAIGERGVEKFDRVLAGTSKLIHPFFLSGDWDSAVHEMCIDLAIGTGALIVIKGTPDDPVRFGSIPIDQIAVKTDAYGHVVFISWRQTFTREQIIAAFPDGKYPDGFREANRTRGNDEIELYQDFYQRGPGPRSGWQFVAYVSQSTEPITQERYRRQPIAVPRYYRVPGEPYGRGVVLTALPSIKTVNKAQEIALKAAAIQMLGIWGYRAGGTFNPDTVRVGPGEFWGMQSTGGILGPDVQRIDPAGGRMDVARMLIGNLQDQIRDAMFDTRLPEYQGTPKAASEIAARLQQKANVHIGAFGRLVREIMPVVVPRVAEILHDFGILAQMPMPIDHLLVAIRVQSPMAAALNADRLASIANYLEFVGSIAGPEKVPLYANLDRIMERVGDGLQIDKDLIPDEAEREKIEKDMAAAQQSQIVELFGAEMAKQAPGMLANAAMKEAA
ncbi:portal protein [Stappia taiwanensis]|uniref:portal protein n=1 Tax=Stappia taiwanensis TaxID=992267 RepID=UPI0015EF31D8|nr:portal protein [Stappia taiwanensis]